MKEIERERLQSRERDISTGQKMVDEDLARTTREKQVAAFKRHEMAKQLRDVWT